MERHLLLTYIKTFLAVFALEVLVELIGYQGLGHLALGALWESDIPHETFIHAAWMLLVSTPVLYWWIMRQIRKERQYADDLRNKEKEFESLFKHSLSAIVAFDMNERVTNCNPAFGEIFGYSRNDVIGRLRESFLPTNKIDSARSYFQKCLEGSPQEFENQIYHDDGHLVTVESINVPIYQNDERVGVYAILKDITHRKNHEQELWNLGHFDYLTKLANRRLFIQRLKEEIELARKSDRRIGVLFIDLDRFKQVNDSLGHALGDKLLVAMAERMQRCLQSQDLLARLGGDEFAVILPDIAHVENAENIAKKLNNCIQHPVLIEDYKLYITSSIGVATYPTNGPSVKDILRSADTAMYTAKYQGKNTYRVHMSSMNEHSYEKLQLEYDLREALVNASNELYVEYQPQVDITTDKVVSAEALVRWNHPILGRIGPDEFIPLAEETGLIAKLDEYVLQQVCAQITEWRAHDIGFNIPIFINISAQEFQDNLFVHRLHNIIEQDKVPIELVGIEITETTLMKNERETVAKLNALRDLGVKIFVDDFGKGYSSLGFLKNFPLDGLKVDKVFVTEIDSSDEDASIVSALVTLAHARKLHVVAEGVERSEQLARLKDTNCDWYQGFMHSRPGPPESLYGYTLQP